jgi:hypothetical protein
MRRESRNVVEPKVEESQEEWQRRQFEPSLSRMESLHPTEPVHDYTSRGEE